MSENILDRILTRMFDLADRKKGLVERIYNITVEQSDLLIPERVEELLAAIERKQECISEITLIDTEVLPLEKKLLILKSVSFWDEMIKDIDEEWERINYLRRQTVSLVEKTRKIEVENLNRFSSEYKKLKKHIQLLHTKKGSVKAYQGSAIQSDGYFVDMKN